MQDSPYLSDFINNPTVRKQQKQRERTDSHWNQWTGITITITRVSYGEGVGGNMGFPPKVQFPPQAS